MKQLTNLQFKKITKSDFKCIFDWLQQTHVAPWWPEPDWDTFVIKYQKKLDSDFVHAYIISLDGNPIGMIQYYWFAKAPQGDESYGRYDDPNLVGLDIVIGDPDYVGKGYGALALGEFVEQVLRPNPLVKRIFINPDANNKAAIRAYEKAGFKVIERVDTPQGKEVVMELEL